jgi:hypothetical protein
MGRHINKDGELLYPITEGDHSGQSKKSNNSPQVILEKTSTNMRNIEMRSVLLRPKKKSRPSGAIKAQRTQAKSMGVGGKKDGVVNLGSSEFPLSNKSPGFPIRGDLLDRIKWSEQPAGNLEVIKPAKGRRKVQIPNKVVMTQPDEVQQILLHVKDSSDKANRSGSLKEVENIMIKIKTSKKGLFDMAKTPKKSSFRTDSNPYGEGTISKSPSIKGTRNLELIKLVIPSQQKSNSPSAIEENIGPEGEESPNQGSRDEGTTPPPKIIILEPLTGGPHPSQQTLDQPDTLVSNFDKLPNVLIPTQKLDKQPTQPDPKIQTPKPKPLLSLAKLTHMTGLKKFSIPKAKRFLSGLFTRKPPCPTHLKACDELIQRYFHTISLQGFPIFRHNLYKVCGPATNFLLQNSYTVKNEELIYYDKEYTIFSLDYPITKKTTLLLPFHINLKNSSFVPMGSMKYYNYRGKVYPTELKDMIEDVMNVDKASVEYLFWVC